MRVLVCGSRDWNDDRAIWVVLGGYTRLKDVVVIHGAAPGADLMAGDIAYGFGLEIENYPAKWHIHGNAAGPIRNQQMLDEGKPDVVYAFKDGFDWEWVNTPGRPGWSPGGTEDMVKRAKDAGIPVYVVSRA